MDRPTIAVSAETPELQSGIFKHLSARTDALVQGSQISFQNTITLPHGSTIFAKGAFELGGGDPALILDAYSNHIPATAIAAILDSTVPVSGDLKAELHMNGPLDNLVGQASVSGDALSLYRERLGQLDMGLRLAGKEVQSTQFILLRDPQNPDSGRLDADIAYSFDSEQFRFQANGKDLEWKKLALSDGSPIQGKMNLVASGSGTADQPSIDVKIEAPDIQLKQRSLGPVSLNAALRNERLTIEAAVSRLNITSTAHVVNETPYAFDGEMGVDPIFAAWIESSE